MTATACAYSETRDSRRAGLELGRELRDGLGGATPDAVIVFASARHDYGALLAALAQSAGTETIAGASSAGEFTERRRGTGCVSAMALLSPQMRFRTGLGRGVAGGPSEAARQVVGAFDPAPPHDMSYRSALVMADALAGHSEALVEDLTLMTGGNHAFFGGGAGDDGAFRSTHVFAGREAATDAVAALEIVSAQPLGIGVSHGWVPAGPAMRVTEADGMRLVGLNGEPAVLAFEDHADAIGQRFDAADPLPFFLHAVIGLRTPRGYRLRVPLSVHDDGSIGCAAAVPPGSVVCLMRASESSAVQAAEQATRAALAALGGARPGAALVFDCVATRLRLGLAFELELAACARLLEPAPFIGCNTYGQIARAEGQFGGFHNCTAVVCALPA